MKVWILAGLFTAAMAPLASASESTLECQLDDTRRATAPRAEAPPTPAPTARPTVAPRETAEQATPRETARRRSGKRIPDAELIGPRGAL
jgi:hypothetical protein